MSRRPCQQCGRNRAERFFTSERGRKCADCRKQNRSDADHARRILATYGLSPSQYERLQDLQRQRCAICDEQRRYRLNVDHDHATGLVRGLLCRRCNKLLRDAADQPDLLRAAAAYLRYPPADVLGIEAVASC